MLKDLGPSLDKGRFFEKMGQLLGDSVVTAAGLAHRNKRRQLQPAFAREEIARYVDIMRDEADAAVCGPRSTPRPPQGCCAASADGATTA
ncbi:hypothetical protein GCM10010228_66720 [Streptomyces massasporeus]|nr:hypothetical protein GCM10010228_66720 [Streptomyces massasporeus]